MLQNNEAFVFLPGFLAVIGIVTHGSKVTFSGRSAAFSSLSLFSLFQTKLVVLCKAVYQNAFLAFENRLNVDLLLSCLGSLS